MKVLLIILFIYLLNFFPVKAVEQDLSYPGEPPDGGALAEQVYYVNHFYAFDILEIDGSKKDLLQIINYLPGSKPKYMRARRFVNHALSDQKLKTRDLVIFVSGKVKGTGILASDYRQQGKPMSISIWLPALRKVRRFSEPAHEDIWAGSILTYGDIYLRRPEDETHELAGEVELVDCLEHMVVATEDRDNKGQLPEQDCSNVGKTVYLLKSTHKKQGWWYDYRLRWIDRENFADYRTHYFKDGKRIKIMSKSWRKLESPDPRAQVWHYWYARSDESGQQGIAIIPIESVRVNTEREERFWSEATLRKIRR